MAGATPAHNQIAFNLAVLIGSALSGGPCRGFSSDQRVRVPDTNLYTYPDLTVVCGEPEYDPLDSDTLTNPALIVEVLSPTTEAWGRDDKFAHYRRLTSLREYGVVSQDRTLIERYLRRGEPGDEWLLTVFGSGESVVTLESVPVRAPLAEIYGGVTLADRPGR